MQIKKNNWGFEGLTVRGWCQRLKGFRILATKTHHSTFSKDIQRTKLWGHCIEIISTYSPASRGDANNITANRVTNGNLIPEPEARTLSLQRLHFACNRANVVNLISGSSYCRCLTDGINRPRRFIRQHILIISLVSVITKACACVRACVWERESIILVPCYRTWNGPYGKCWSNVVHSKARIFRCRSRA
jgi:hypothetical protein